MIPIPIIDSLINGVTAIAKRYIPDPAAQASFELEMRKADMTELQVAMSAIIEEGKSEDPWTSRGRPMFLYVIYIMILFSLPMGILSAFKPEMATAIAHGMQAWLTAIPDSLWALFGAGYLGYTGARSFDKAKELKAGK